MQENMSLEEKYLMIIKGIVEAKNRYDFITAEEYEKAYLGVCEALTMKYIKSKGISELPYFGEVPEYKYDDQLKEYVNENINLPYDLEKLKEKYCI